jgi:hypothetical protein
MICINTRLLFHILKASCSNDSICLFFSKYFSFSSKFRSIQNNSEIVAFGLIHQFDLLIFTILFLKSKKKMKKMKNKYKFERKFLKTINRVELAYIDIDTKNVL